MRSVVVLSFSLALACQADKPVQPPPRPPPRPTHRAGAAVRPDAPPGAEPAHVRLPRSPDTPPRRTTRPLGKTDLERLAAFEFPDFRREDRGTTGAAAEVLHTTVTRPTLGVAIRIERCGAPEPPARALANAASAPKPLPRGCLAMAPDVWRARAGQLEQALPAELRARPDTRFELGARDLGGATAIYTYQLGAAFGDDASGQPTGSYSDAYILYYNDGVNQIRVNAAYLDDAVDDRGSPPGGSAAEGRVGVIDHLLAVAPPEDLDKLAVAFLRFYLHEWSGSP